MLPCPRSRPDYLALRSVLLGALAGMGWLLWQGHSGAEALALVQDTLVVDAMGNTVIAALAGRCLSTLLVVLGAMALAFCTALSLALTVRRLNRRLLGGTSLLGHALAALPIAGLGWWAMTTVIDIAQLPIESLIPYVPPPERDGWTLALGRSLWAWLLPLWVLALPLFGECLHAVSDALRSAWPLSHQLGMHAAGHRLSTLRAHELAIVWTAMHERWHSVGLLALGYTVALEHAFGLPGWGGFFANSLLTGNSFGIAAAMYAAGWLAAAWAGLSALLRRCTWGSYSVLASAAESRPSPRPPSLLGVLIMALCTVVFIGVVPVYAPDSWVRALLMMWVHGVLSEHFTSTLLALLPALRSDLYVALLATVGALAVVILRGGLAWCFHAQDRLPRLLLLETACWSPLLAWAFAFAVPTHGQPSLWVVLGVVGGMTGARPLSDLSISHRSTLPVDAARVLGMPSWTRWRRHVLPPLLRCLGGWALHLFGTLLLWTVLLRSLAVPYGTGAVSSLGLMLAQAQTTVLTDASTAYMPSLLTAITVLYFWRLARMMR